MLKIKILYDNISIKKGVKPAWGFSALIECGGKKILFDTGGKADLLLSNMKAMMLFPRTLTDIFLSHMHWDHTGGLFGFLIKNNKVKVFVPHSFSRAYCDEIKAGGAGCVANKNMAKISNGIYSSGMLGEENKEQSLILDTNKGLVLITGCSHPGIVNIIRRVKKELGKEIYFVLGGFHLYNLTNKEIYNIIGKLKKLGVKKIAPCHCTGKKAINIFKKEFGNEYIEIGAGSVVSID